MPLYISNDATTEKNKLHSENAWLVLLDIEHTSESTVIRLVNNNENITWPTAGGNEYTSSAFEMSSIKQDSEGSIPTVDLTVTDFGGSLIELLDEYNGGIGATVTIRIVISEYLSNTSPEYEDKYEIIDVSVNSQYQINFRLGTPNPLKYRIPQDRYLKDHCRYKEFKGSLCGYAGIEATCDRSFARCRELLNSTRYGACPGIGEQAYNE